MHPNSIKEDLRNIRVKIKDLKIIQDIHNIEALEKLENKYLGRKAGEITLILKELSKLSLEEKKEIGVLANDLKNEIISEIKAQRDKLSNVKTDLNIDVTLPANSDKLGHLHPISKVQYEL
ncbi:MAG: hypothetical protein V1649_04030, partial [Patescibacteria group bacterium]